MTPTPDAKSAQPEQLVERIRHAASVAHELDTDGVRWVELPADDVLALATALSECREREWELDVASHAALEALKRSDPEAASRILSAALAAQPPSEASEAADV
jgi:hypothetical protein